MRTPYEDYVRLYLSMDYSRDESEFYASIILETDEEVQSMVQSMVQNVSDEEDNTWGNWTAQGKLQQAPSQAPTACLRRAESDSQERSNRIARRIQVLLNSGYKCVSQAHCQAESWIVSKKCLTKIELDKIKEECKDKCCNPCTNELHRHESQQFVDRVNTTISEAATEHSESPVADKKNETTILEAATKHSIFRRLLTLADENPKSCKAATKHSERSKKLGKGTASHAREKSPVPNDAADNEVSVATAVPTLTPQQMPLTPPMNSDDEIPVATTVPTPTPPAEVPTPTLLPSNDKQEPAPAPPPEQAPNAADAVCTAATRKRTDSESSDTDDDYESWLQSHAYST